MFENILLDTIEDVELELGSCRRRLTNQKKEYDDVFRTYTFLKNAIDNIKIKDTCPICLDDIQDDSIAITQCGHKFCKECIHEYINQTYSSKCPNCNIPIKLDEIYLLEEKIECKIDNDLNNIIQRVKSTKIGNIIYYIKNKLKNGDKCIIFSQWNEILVKVSKFLTSEKIPTLFCTGTVYNRKKSIDSFQKNPKTNVICLSSVNCASGINLTAANKIIFIEPIYGSKEYRKDIENQASGRANRLGQTRDIEVLRFIIKDSIEEEIYNDNEKDNVLINTENILVL
jgi:SNF2 family DNA or RNA helicase